MDIEVDFVCFEVGFFEVEMDIVGECDEIDVEVIDVFVGGDFFGGIEVGVGEGGVGNSFGCGDGCGVGFFVGGEDLGVG